LKNLNSNCNLQLRQEEYFNCGAVLDALSWIAAGSVSTRIYLDIASHCCRIIVVIAMVQLPPFPLTLLNLCHKLCSCLRIHMAGFCFNTTNTIAPWGNAADAAMLPTSAALILFASEGIRGKTIRSSSQQSRQSYSRQRATLLLT